MSAAGLTRRGRRAAEALMLDSCTVMRLTGSVTNPETGAETPSYEVVYIGKCKVQSRNQYELVDVAGGHQFVTQRSELQFPVGSFEMKVGDLTEIDSSDAPFLSERTYRLAVEAPFRTFETAYRVFADLQVA